MRQQRLILILALFLSTSSALFAQVRYGYAPGNAPTDELSGLGGGKNQFVQGLVLFNPATDPALDRMKGLNIKGVRCYLRADYKQARQRRSAILACTGTPDNIVRTTYVDFVEGWNEVLFEEPLAIGDEPIYLGLQAYETIGTPYPLVTYALANVPQSCIINLGKKTWEEINDRGTLLVEALLDDAAAVCIERTAYAQNTTHPQTVAPDADFEGGLYVHNFTDKELTSIEVAMQGEGATVATLRTITLPRSIDAYGSIVLTTQLRAGTTEGTSVGWTATVTKMDGIDAQAGRPGTTSLYVTRDNFIRTPLIEEFTSQRCINCPQMAYFLDKALEEYDGSYVYVAHHSGFVEDVFTTDVDREVLYLFGGEANEYNPAIMYNRAIFEGENTIIQGIRDMSKTPYLEALAIAADMPAMAEVRLSTTDVSVRVSGRVAHDLVNTPLYLSCYLVEDGISAQRYPQTGLTGDDDAPEDLQEVFRHNGVILHHFTTNAIGDRLDIQPDGSYSVDYPLVDKEGFGGTARRIVAFVHRIDKSNLRQNVVLNAAQITPSGDGIKEIKENGEASADNLPTEGLQGAYDLCGRKVIMSRSFNRESVNSKLPKGLYIVDGKKVAVR